MLPFLEKETKATERLCNLIVLTQQVTGSLWLEPSSPTSSPFLIFPAVCPHPWPASPCSGADGRKAVLLLNCFYKLGTQTHYLHYFHKLFRTANMLWKISPLKKKDENGKNPTILIIMQSNHSVKLIKDFAVFYAPQSQMWRNTISWLS